VPLVKRAVWSVDPAQPLSNIKTASAFLSASLGPQRFRSTLLAVFAGLGLLLSVVGIYGVTARSVIERTREVGIRLALGGRPIAVWQTIALRSFRAVAIGTAIGILISLPVLHVLRMTLPETAGSVLTLWPALLILLVTGAIAALWPAHKVTRADPVVALRD
jgi:putative ABC transport system permease protein